MRPSLRFLVIAVIGWTGLRAATLGALPGAEIFRIDHSEAKPPPIIPTEFPPIEPLPAAADLSSDEFHKAALEYSPAQPGRGAPHTIVVPVYYAAASSAPGTMTPTRLSNVLPEPRRQFYSPIPVLDEWPLSRMAAASASPIRPTVVTPNQSLPAALKRSGIDRLQLTAWALLRSQSTGIAGPQSLANGGSLGGSQAGARLTYNFTRQLAATMRSTSEVGGAVGKSQAAFGSSQSRAYRCGLPPSGASGSAAMVAAGTHSRCFSREACTTGRCRSASC